MSAANIPNEPGSWDADFSYSHLAERYAVLRREFVPTLVGDAGEPAPQLWNHIIYRAPDAG